MSWTALIIIDFDKVMVDFHGYWVFRWSDYRIHIVDEWSKIA